jgi:hypothetical protein
MKGRFYVPPWVNLVYRLLEWLDYKILSPISSRLVWWRNGLLEHYCRCEKCLERKRTGTL